MEVGPGDREKEGGRERGREREREREREEFSNICWVECLVCKDQIRAIKSSQLHVCSAPGERCQCAWSLSGFHRYRFTGGCLVSAISSIGVSSLHGGQMLRYSFQVSCGAYVVLGCAVKGQMVRRLYISLPLVVSVKGGTCRGRFRSDL